MPSLLRTILSLANAYAPAAVFLGLMFAFIPTVYMIPVVVSENPPYAACGTAFLVVCRIGALIASLAGFSLMLMLVGLKWDFNTLPMSERVNRNAKILFGKCFTVWLLIMALSPALDLFLEPYHVNVASWEVGVIVAVFVVLYGATTRITIFNEIVRDIIVGLGILVILVYTFVAIPSRFPPPADMYVIAVLAGVVDLLLSIVTTGIIGFLESREEK